LQAALERLAEADILLVEGLPPESDYRFKHSLIQDAAYENLLKSRRQVLHRRVAELFVSNFTDTVEATRSTICLCVYRLRLISLGMSKNSFSKSARNWHKMSACFSNSFA
jgi:hypothetical protein